MTFFDDDETARKAAQFFAQRERDKIEPTKPRKVIDKRRVTLDNCEGMIPMGKGRPNREGLVINKDDLTNLKIILGKFNHIEEFIEAI